MYKGRLQKIKAENIMNLDLRVGRYRSQITMFKRAEIVRRGKIIVLHFYYKGKI